MIVVLYRPEIPQNTGNIVRTCSVTNTDLLLVPPLGFDTSDKRLKRAGLDYWNEVKIEEIENFETYLENFSSPFYFLSSKGTTSYSDVKYTDDTHIIFGSETSGLPPYIHEKYAEKMVTIPMKKGGRCLNLSNAVSIVLYEGLRQQKFSSLL